MNKSSEGMEELKRARPIFLNVGFIWLAALALTIVGLGGATLFFRTRSNPTVEGTRWEGALALPAQAASTAWTQLGGDATHAGSRAGLGTLQGREAWQLTTGGPVISAPVAGAGVVYFASGDGFLYAVEGASGKTLWRASLGPKLVNSTPVLSGGLILVAGDYTWLSALDTRTGQRVWRYDTGDNILAPPAADAQAGLAFVTSGSNLFALDLRDGQRRWLLQLSDTTRNSWPSVGAPAIMAGTVVWAPGVGSRVWALDEATGNTRWSFDARDRLASTPVIRDDTVYIATWTGNLFALDLKTGAARWETKLGHGAPGEGTESTPALEANRLFIGSYQGTLYALDPSTGADLWRFQTNGQILAAPAVSGGIVYCASGDGYLYALDAAQGKLQWKLQLGEMRGSPALASNALYIGSLSGSFFQIK
jgi:eukaryotic-like serine/threonine-protein kinase